MEVQGFIEGYYELLKEVTEALIFASDVALQADEIAAVIAAVRDEDPAMPEEIDAIVSQLNADYEATGRAFRIQRLAGGYRMVTHPTYAPYLTAFVQQQKAKRLSRSLVETVAVVAYKQPVTKAEIEFVRGVDCDYALRRLLELELITVGGRSETLGRPLLYETTSLFMERFGLHSLADLPSLREIEEMLQDPAFKREKAQLLFEKGLSEAVAQDVAPGDAPSQEDEAKP